MNTGTIDTILQTLMDEGLKIDGGEKLGKSIILHIITITQRLL